MLEGRLRMNRLAVVTCSLIISVLALAVPGTAPADDDHVARKYVATLTGFEETPLAILSEGKGTLQLTLDKQLLSATYTITFSGLGSPVTQSHIHFGKRHVTGGIFVFFCTNLGNGPAGTQACPAGGGTVTGTITAANIIGLPAQGTPAGDFDVLVDALESNTAYANVHSNNFPSGEIRGQVHKFRGDD